MVSDVRFVHSQTNLHLLFSKWASCYFQHWYQSWHLLFHRNQWESIRRTLQLLSFAILWRQWTPYLIQICTEIACKTHFFWKYNDLFFLESAAKRRDRWIGSNDDGDVNAKGRKAIGLNWPNNNFARTSRFLGTFLCRHFTTTTWKCLISRFVENVNTRQRLSFFFSRTSIHYLEFNSRINCQH